MKVGCLQRAFTETLLQGDSDGKPHLFPNTIYALRDKVLKDEFTDDVGWYTNYQLSMEVLISLTCSPATVEIWPTTWVAEHLNDNWTGDWDKDCLRTGNLAYVTLNLPRIAYQSRDEEDIFEYLDNYLRLAEDVLLLRRQQAMNCLDNFNLLPFLTQETDGERYYRVDNATLSFGFVGLNEMLLAHCDAGIEDNDSRKLGLKVLEYMNKRADELKNDTGYRWSVLQTPAESTAYRFATLDREKFGEQTVTQGDDQAAYYTNSSHVPVNSEVNLPRKSALRRNSIS